jgi:hypothetical protein
MEEISAGKLGGGRQLRKPGHRCENNIEKEFRETV